MSVHTSIDYGDVWSTNQRRGLFWLGDSGFTEEDDDDDEEYDDTKIEKSCRSGFSHGKLETGGNELGLCTAIYESKSCC